MIIIAVRGYVQCYLYASSAALAARVAGVGLEFFCVRVCMVWFQ